MASDLNTQGRTIPHVSLIRISPFVAWQKIRSVLRDLPPPQIRSRILGKLPIVIVHSYRVGLKRGKCVGLKVFTIASTNSYVMGRDFLLCGEP